MRNLQSPFDIVMVWYQNDWGLYGRRNEFIAHTLLKHKRVRNVLHIEPPLDLEYLHARLRSDSLDDNIHTNLKRLNLCDHKGIFLYTPHTVRGMSPQKTALSLQDQINQAIAACKMDNILLWLYPPHPFVEFTLNLLKTRAALIVSDCVDDHRQYAGTDKDKIVVEKRYANTLSGSDIVFFVSKVMRNEMARYNPRSFYIPNAVSADIFNKNELGLTPADMAKIKHPIIGYAGALSLRIDDDLLRFVAESKPKWNIVLIGTSPNTKIRTLLELPNVYWLGSMRHKDIYDRLSQFDVCILPHAVNSMTDKMNPLKLYEYLALGKPVVSTDVAGAGMFKADIEIASTRGAFLDAIEKVLSKDCLKQHEKRIDRVRNHTWSNRIDEMMELALNAFKAKTLPRGTAANKQYYSFDRPEVRECIPATAEVILDIGCASGRLGGALKKERDCVVVGIEYEPEIANEAKYLLDDVLVGDVEEKIDNLPSDYFDCIVLADVLEHLRDPETILKNLHRTLKKNGTIVASIPNVLHWSVILPLLEGNWNYEDAGILDRTHLRFFTKRSILSMFSTCGYAVKDLKATKFGSSDGSLQIITKALFEAGIDTKALSEASNHYQYIVDAEKVMQIIENVTSIIILTYNQLEYTKKCLESIAANTPEPHEIIIVDNGSTDGTVEWLRNLAAENSDYRVIENKENLGFALGNNKGIAEAKGDYVVLMNNDVVVTPGWLKRLVKVAKRKPQVGIVGPMSNYVSGPQLVKEVTYKKTSLSGLSKFSKAFARKHAGQTMPYWRVVGFCMLIKREVIDKIGGLDGRFGLGNFEDDDFSLRAALAGFESWIVKDCFVHHFGSRTFAGAKIDFRESLHKNWEIFKEKWGIPADVAYGASYDMAKVVKNGFIPEKHYCPLSGEESAPSDLSREMEDTDAAKKMYQNAQMLVEKGMDNAAIMALGKLLESYPEFALAHNDLGVLYYKAGKKEEAFEHYKKAAELQPKNINFQKNLADFYYVELGKVQEAIEIYVKILALNPQDIECLLMLGHISISIEKTDDARVFYMKVLESDPDNAVARQNLDSIQKYEQGAAV